MGVPFMCQVKSMGTIYNPQVTLLKPIRNLDYFQQCNSSFSVVRFNWEELATKPHNQLLLWMDK